MLIYHPLYDAYNCVFRLLFIIERLGNAPLDMARLLDFYVLFPSRVAKIRLPSNLSYGRSLASRRFNPYHEISNQQSAFRELMVIQDAALHCIVGAGLVDKSQFDAGFLTRTKQPLPFELKLRLEKFELQKRDILDFILDKLSEIKVFGVDGLKHRTGLMEYRYDKIS
jgi:hypothetical protein